MHLHDGQLIIDGQRVLQPYLGHDMISWSQRTKDHYTSGHLWIGDKGATVQGVVYRGADVKSAKAEHVVGTAIPPVPYKTKITAKRYPEGTDPATLPPSDWGNGLTLSIGFVQAVGQGAPTTQVLLDGQDISTSVAWSIDQKNQKTVLSINVDSFACQFDSSLYLTGSVEFDISQPIPTFSGSLTSTCADQDGKGVYFWKGTAGAAQQNPTALKAHQTVAPLTASDILAADGLSLPELMSIVPDDSVSTQANNLLVENMKWAMGQNSTEKGWLEMFFGENPPVLSPAQQQVAQKSTNWYQQTFSKSYLGWAITNYTGPNAPSTNLSSDQELQLKYFLQTGMAKDPDFNIQQNGIYVQAFIDAKPRLQNYINDTSSNWAQQLYDAITAPAQFTLMVNRVWGAAGQQGAMTPANNFATLLSALQPSSQLAKQYIQSVISGTLYNSVHQSTVNASDMMEWLPAFLQEFLNQIATQGNVPDSAKLAAEQLKQMLADAGGNMTTVAQELSNFVVNANGANILEKTQNAQSAFLQKFPKFAAVGQMLFFAAWCMGVIMIVKAFQNWKNLKPEDKAKAIVTAVALGFQALDVVPQFIGGIKEMGLKGWNEFQAWRNGPDPQEDMIEMNEMAGGEDWVANGVNETTPLFDAAEGTIKTTGTAWESLFSVASKVVAVVGVVVSAAFAVFSTIDFVNDIKSGQPITKIVFDGIMMVTNIATTVCIVLDLVLTTTIFAMAAAVLAIVGVIIAIIEMFVVKPKNPLDSFMSDTVIPFVKGLPPQTPPPGSLALVAVVA